jgi:hypothetical protein
MFPTTAIEKKLPTNLKMTAYSSGEGVGLTVDKLIIQRAKLKIALLFL